MVAPGVPVVAVQRITRQPRTLACRLPAACPPRAPRADQPLVAVSAACRAQEAVDRVRGRGLRALINRLLRSLPACRAQEAVDRRVGGRLARRRGGWEAGRRGGWEAGAGAGRAAAFPVPINRL